MERIRPVHHFLAALVVLAVAGIAQAAVLRRSSTFTVTVGGARQSAITVSWPVSRGVHYDASLNGARVATGLSGPWFRVRQGLNCGTSYLLGIDSGSRSLSATTRASTAACPVVADTTPPTAPTNLQVLSASTTGVSVGWTHSVDNVAVTGYRIYFSGAVVTTIPWTTTTFSFSNLSVWTLSDDRGRCAGRSRKRLADGLHRHGHEPLSLDERAGDDEGHDDDPDDDACHNDDNASACHHNNDHERASAAAGHHTGDDDDPDDGACHNDDIASACHHDHDHERASAAAGHHTGDDDDPDDGAAAAIHHDDTVVGRADDEPVRLSVGLRLERVFQAAPCASLNGAYQLAKAGQTISTRPAPTQPGRLGETGPAQPVLHTSDARLVRPHRRLRSHDRRFAGDPRLGSVG